jgi:deoxycytidylate deaminase
LGSEGHKDCREAGCPRCINGGVTGSGYETCVCIHAEQRAIADAARRGVSTDNSVLYVNLRPCLQCLAIAKAAGIRRSSTAARTGSIRTKLKRSIASCPVSSIHSYVLQSRIHHPSVLENLSSYFLVVS